jgi:enoyl-CoA hydratase/carnithine racemase
MLYESPSITVTADDGIATLVMSFSGSPANRLSAARLIEIGQALEQVRRNPHIEILVLRSGKPGGFCSGFDPNALGGLTTDADAATFAGAGQQVLGSLANAPFITLAYLHGPCLGPGLELALACDYRLAVAGPDAWIALGEFPTCWGGRTRLNQLVGRRRTEQWVRERFTVREANKLGVVDQAFCERRSKIELRSWLDLLQRHPRKPQAWWGDTGVERAAERVAFRTAVRGGLSTGSEPPVFDHLNPVQPLQRVGLVGSTEQVNRLTAEWAMRGVNVIRVGGDSGPAFRTPLARGRITPLEAEQAAGRITIAPDAEAVASTDFVYLDDSAVTTAGLIERELLPRAILAVPPGALPRVVQLASRPGRVVGIEFADESAVLHRTEDTTPDILASVSEWLTDIGCRLQSVRQSVASRLLISV